MSRPRRVELGTILLTLAAAAVLHGGALRGWWLTDDPQILLHALRHSPWEVLTEPAAYRELSAVSFTPLQTISSDLDLALAGLRPWAFYFHQLLALALAAGMLGVLVYRLGGPPFAAAMTALIFLAGPQAALAARTVWIRHYVEGLLLAVLALVVWTGPRDGKRDSTLRCWLAAPLYLGAMIAKELYAPLPLLVLAIDFHRGYRLRRMAVRIVPLAVSAAAYLLWRTAMLGPAGGYGSRGGSSTLLDLPLWLTRELAGLGVDHLDPTPRVVPVWMKILAIIAGAAFLAVIGWAFRRAPKIVAVALVSIVVTIILPIAVVSDVPNARYAFAAGAAAAAAFGLAVGALWEYRRFVALAIAAFAVLAGAVAGGRLVARESAEEARAMVAEGRYVWERGGDDAPLLAKSPGWYVEGLSTLRRETGRSPAPRVVMSLHGLTLVARPDERFVSSEYGRSEVVPLSAGEANHVVMDRRLRSDEPLWLKFSRSGNDISWELGPDEGTFIFLSVPWYDDYAIPAKGWRRQPEPREAQHFRIRRQLADGRWTVSPVLTLPRSGETTEWSSAAGAR